LRSTLPNQMATFSWSHRKSLIKFGACILHVALHCTIKASLEGGGAKPSAGTTRTP
jgi:hypothetical protein